MSSATAVAPKLAKSTVIRLADANISESILEKLIADDPAILGLGEVVVIERQRVQERAGRLDLLLEDGDGETRYEVELMLGSLDESHLVRAVEYWDIERRRYPGYDHRAVIIAEDVTSRFLNVIQLFSGAIPIITIQVNCIQVGDNVAVNFIKLVDSIQQRRDDISDVKGKAADRNYWVSRVGSNILSIADECLALINETAKRKRGLNYNKGYIGLSDGAQPNNFCYFSPRKSFLRLRVTVTSPEKWKSRLEEADIDYKIRADGLRINLTMQDYQANKALLSEILKQSVNEDES